MSGCQNVQESDLAPIIVENPTPTETPELTETPKPTAIPTPTAIPKPTATPALTETPEPTATSALTETPEPTELPTLTETPEPTATSALTATPEPTAIPTPTETPELTATPAPTAIPKPTATPTPKVINESGMGVIKDEIQIAPMSVNDLIHSSVLLKSELYVNASSAYLREKFYNINIDQEAPKIIKTLHAGDKVTSIGVANPDSVDRANYILMKDKIYWLAGGVDYMKRGIDEKIGSVSWTGDEIYLESLDITIPRLSEFNTHGIIYNNKSTFAGDVDGEGLATLLNTIKKVKTRLIEMELLPSSTREIVMGPYIPSSSEPYTSDFIEFCWSPDDAMRVSTLSLQRETGYEDEDGSYYLMIYDDLKEGVNSRGVDMAKYNKDIVLFLLSVVSTTPEQLYDFIYRDIYDTAIYGSTTEFVQVGDCAIRFAGEKSGYALPENSDNGQYKFYYQIKKNPTVYEQPKEEKTDLATTGDNKLELKWLSLVFPKLNYFNSQALLEGSGWFGNVNAPGYLKLQNATLDNLSAVKRKLMLYEYLAIDGRSSFFCMSDKQIGFTISDDKICWYWDENKSVPTLMIERIVEENMYRVTVNTNLHRDKVNAAYDRSIYTREILEIMLSLISSTPEKLLNHIYCGSCWTSDYRADNMVCGDCIIDYDETASANSTLRYHHVFEIREAK